jgi:hypothetical protein
MKQSTVNKISYDSIQFFNLERAIENIPIVSILVSSLYRNLKLVSSTEITCNHNAQSLYSALNQSTNIGALFTNEELVQLFNTSLSVPTSESQLKQKKFWVSPLVPEIGNYGLAARNVGQPWNPGAFILEIIANYSSDIDQFVELIKNLILALEVQDKDNDIWSLCVKNEFAHISENLGLSQGASFNEQYFRDFYQNKNRPEKKLLHFSEFARNTIIDIQNIINLKNRLTRQKWIGFFEGFIRLTMFNHIIYTLNFSKNYFNFLEEKLNQGSTQVLNEDFYKFINLGFNINDVRIKVGTARKDYIRENIESFAYFNSLVSELLNHCGYSNFKDFDSEYEFTRISEDILKTIQSQENLKNFKIQFQNDNEIELLKFNENFSSLKNIKESLGYLCSRKSSSKEKYISDVNFLFDKSGNNLNSPYYLKISSGLISTLTSLIFLRKEDTNSFISGLEFIKGLNEYNIQLSINDISSGDIKNTMLSLGIVIDCPDTEGGVLIIKPAWIKQI